MSWRPPWSSAATHGHTSSSLEVLPSVFWLPWLPAAVALKGDTLPKALLVHPSAGPLCLLTLLFQGDPDQGVADEVRVLLGQWWRQLRANGDSGGFCGSIQMWLLGWRQFYGL